MTEVFSFITDQQFYDVSFFMESLIIKVRFCLFNITSDPTWSSQVTECKSKYFFFNLLWKIITVFLHLIYSFLNCISSTQKSISIWKILISTYSNKVSKFIQNDFHISHMPEVSSQRNDFVICSRLFFILIISMGKNANWKQAMNYIVLNANGFIFHSHLPACNIKIFKINSAWKLFLNNLKKKSKLNSLLVNFLTNAFWKYIPNPIQQFKD